VHFSISNSDVKISRAAAKHVNSVQRQGAAYVTWIIVGILIGLSVVAAVNVIMDPFAQRWPRLFPKLSPDFEFHDREVRINLTHHRRPQFIILGNSRTQHGLDPQSESIRKWMPFNASFAGATPKEVVIFLRELQNEHWAHAIIGLDFFMLWPDPEVHINSKLLVTSPFSMLNRVQTSVSFAATLASIRSIARRPSYVDDDGATTESLFRRNEAALGGRTAATLFLEKQLVRNMRRLSLDANFFIEFDEMLKLLCRSQTDIVVLMPPAHVRQLTIYHALGEWGRFEDWKRKIVQISGRFHECPISVWDFATYNSVTTQDFSDPASPGGYDWFWEVSHFRKAIGDEVLGIVYGDIPEHNNLELGALLRDEMLEEHLTVQRRLQTYYENKLSQMTDEIRLITRELGR